MSLLIAAISCAVLLFHPKVDGDNGLIVFAEVNAGAVPPNAPSILLDFQNLIRIVDRPANYTVNTTTTQFFNYILPTEFI